MAGVTALRQELKIIRTFDAPRERVWLAWTMPELIRRWWGPKYFTSPFSRIDLNIGGKYLFAMRGQDGKDYWSTGVYLQIEPLAKLVYTDSFSDEKGNIVSPVHYGMSAEMALEMIVTVMFEDIDGRTKMTITQDGFPEGNERGLARAGWQQSFDKLEELVTGQKHTEISAEPGKQELFVTHVFNAERAKVYKIYTDPKLISKWWGPSRLSTKIDKYELRPGGMWRFIQNDKNGREFAFRGFYHDIEPNSRIVSTFEFEGAPGHVLLLTVTFEDMMGKTKVTEQSVFQSVADRDNMVKAGMDEGVYESSERFTRLLNNFSNGQRYLIKDRFAEILV
jgi:uncharacterized protein YndB with AHSA1/START domain